MKPTTSNLPAYGAKASQRGLAAVLGCDPSVISGLFARGVLPAGGRIIDWLRCAWAHRGEVAAGRAGDDQAELTRQRAREAAASASLKELQYLKATGELVDVESVFAFLSGWVIGLRTEVETGIDRLVAELESRHNIVVDQQYVDQFTAALLDRLSEPPAMSADGVTIDQVDDD